MPVTFDPNKTIEENIAAAQKRLKSGEIDYQKYDEEVKGIYTSVFALRTAGQVLRDSKATRQKKLTQQAYEQQYNLLKGSRTFGEFVKENMDSSNDIRKGHGGAAEDEFKAFIRKKDRLPSDVPIRYMPTCKERVEDLQDQLKKKDAKSDDAVRIYSEIFRARRAVGARHDDKTAKDRPNYYIPGANYAKTPDMEKNKTFREFVNEKGDEFKKKIGAGHGGAAEHMFRDYVTEKDHLPEDVPQQYAPTAGKRIEAIQKKIKDDKFANLSEEKQQEYYIELMAARSCVGAERGNARTMERYIDPKNHGAWVNYWKNSQTLKDFLKENPNMAKKAAKAGHGGELEDKLKEYISKLDKVPNDVPAKYMPDGKLMIEGVQEKIEAADFNNKKPEEKLALYAKLMATREVVGAEKGKVETLQRSLNGEMLQKSINKWTNNKTFREFLEKDPEAARKAAREGHGGELGEKFKEYVKNMDHIPADIPTPFMPDAKERTKILQDKIKETRDAKKRAELYKELMATRASVEAVRGDSDSLERKINAGKLNEAYGTLNKSISFKNFVSRTPADELYEAARSGHGGALEDAYTNYAAERTWTIGCVPSGVPDRFRPSPDAVLNKYRTELTAENKNKPDNWYAENHDKIMKRTAQMLYLTQVNSKFPSAKDRRGEMSHDKMQDGVQKIMEDGKFKNMFRNLGPKGAMQLMTGKSMTPLMEAYRNAPEPAPAVNPQPNRQPNRPALQDPNHAPAQNEAPAQNHAPAQNNAHVQNNNPQIRQPGA